MKVFEVMRPLNGQGFIVGVFHYYPYVPVIKLRTTEELWYLQGEILGNLS